MGEGAVDP
jgi:SNF2 family DNA or RNA helicase